MLPTTFYYINVFYMRKKNYNLKELVKNRGLRFLFVFIQIEITVENKYSIKAKSTKIELVNISFN